jgi:hypothetical protein
MPILDKEIIAPDDYHTPDGVVRATPRRIRHWLSMFKRMKKKGLPVPIPWEHQEGAKPDPAARLANQAKHNAGHVDDMFLDRNGALWGKLNIPRDDHARQIKENVKFVSPEIDDEWEDGDGEVWHDIITHVAVTPRPVHYKQKPFGTKAKLSQPRRGVVWLSLNQGRNFRRLAQKRRRLCAEDQLMGVKTKTKGKAKTRKLSESEGQKQTTEDELKNMKREETDEGLSIQMSGEDDEDYEGDDEGGEGGIGGEGGAGGGEPDEQELIDELIPILDEKFKLHLPEHVTPKSFIRDILMACHGHPGWEDHEGGAGGEGGEDEGEGGEQLSEEDHDGSDPNYGMGERDMNAREEMPVAMMSANVKRLSAQVKELEADNASLKADKELDRLSQYEAEGRCSPATARQLRSEIGKKRLSFASKKDNNVAILKARLDQIAETPEGTFGEKKQKRLSQGREEKSKTEWGREDGKKQGPISPERAKEAAEEQLRSSGIKPRT